MKTHRTVQQTDEDLSNNDWRDKVTVADKYEKHRLELLKLMEEFADMWNGRLGQNTTSNYRIKLTNNDVHPTHTAAHRT